MGELDSIAFTGSIGEHDIRTRLEVCDGLDSLGVRIDRQKNEEPPGLPQINFIRSLSRAAIYVLPGEKKRMIAKYVIQLLGSSKHRFSLGHQSILDQPRLKGFQIFHLLKAQFWIVQV